MSSVTAATAAAIIFFLALAKQKSNEKDTSVAKIWGMIKWFSFLTMLLYLIVFSRGIGLLG